MNYRNRSICFAVLFVISAFFPFAGLPASRAKAADDAKSSKVTCATCHNAVVTSYSTAPMRHAIEPEGASAVLNEHPYLKVQTHGFSYLVQTKSGQSTYTVSNGVETMSLPIRWSFGRHAQTWILQKDGHLYESFVSYFPRDNEIAVTPGDEQIVPHNLTEAIGRQLPNWEVHACFNCHASNIAFGETGIPASLTPGLECERCHSDSQKHMVDAERGNFRSLPQSLKHLDAEHISDLCGQCHRTFDGAMRNHWRGPAYVRFQPYRLELSKCFIGSDARISCIACHDPHKPASHEIGLYDTKCLACHTRSAPASGGISAKICPVAGKNCVTCHMPKVQLPGGHAEFTDHFIRIVKSKGSYPD